MRRLCALGFLFAVFAACSAIPDIRFEDDDGGFGGDASTRRDASSDGGGREDGGRPCIDFGITNGTCCGSVPCYGCGAGECAKCDSTCRGVCCKAQGRVNCIEGSSCF